MIKIIEKYFTALVLLFLSAISLVLSGCAPLLVGAGAVGGYKVAEHTGAHDHD